MPEPIRAEQIIGNFTHVEPWREVGTADNPSFENSWASTDSTRVARFMKDPMGFVHLAGRIDTGTDPSIAFTLPAGYLPDYTDSTNTSQGFNCYTESASGNGRVRVIYDGGVLIQTYTTAIYLDGIVFRAAT